MTGWDVLALVLALASLLAVVSVGRSLRRALHHTNPAEAVLALIDDDGDAAQPK